MIPKLLDYALMAKACYNREAQVPGWQRQSWHHITDGPFAFTAASFVNDTDMVIAYAGTVPTNMADVTSDMKIGVGIIPKHAYAALAQFDTFVLYRGDRRLSIVGHSLGGAIAQYVAYYFPMNGTGYALDYVTFCAPGITLAGKPTAADPGRHYIVPEDIVHTAGSNSHRKLIKLRGISHVNLPECHYMTAVIERVKLKAD